MKRDLYAGIDLAGSPSRKTGWAVIDDEKKLFEHPCHLFSDEEILERIRKLSPAWIAIDAPLSLPKGKGGNYATRSCDRQLAKIGAPALSPALLGPLTFRGVHLAEILKKEGYRFIEVYPRATEKVLQIKVEGRKPTLKWRRSLQERLSFYIDGIPSSQEKLFSAHILDAVLCAYTAYCRGKEKYEEIGDEEGMVIVPKGI